MYHRIVVIFTKFIMSSAFYFKKNIIHLEKCKFSMYERKFTKNEPKSNLFFGHNNIIVSPIHPRGIFSLFYMY